MQLTMLCVCHMHAPYSHNLPPALPLAHLQEPFCHAQVMQSQWCCSTCHREPPSARAVLAAAAASGLRHALPLLLLVVADVSPGQLGHAVAAASCVGVSTRCPCCYLSYAGQVLGTAAAQRAQTGADRCPTACLPCQQCRLQMRWHQTRHLPRGVLPRGTECTLSSSAAAARAEPQT